MFKSCVSDPNLDRLLSSRGCIINFQEWWYYQTPISTSATQSIQIPVAFKNVAAIVWGITRVADATAQAYAGKFNLMGSENTAILSLNLRINSQKRYNDNLIGSGQCVAETKRTFPSPNFQI